MSIYTLKAQFHCFLFFNIDDDDDDEVDDDADQSLNCEGCEREKERCSCQEVLDTFCSWNSMLHSLGVLKKVVSDDFVSVIHSEVR